jgi:hypothetical protein
VFDDAAGLGVAAAEVAPVATSAVFAGGAVPAAGGVAAPCAVEAVAGVAPDAEGSDDGPLLFVVEAMKKLTAPLMLLLLFA